MTDAAARALAERIIAERPYMTGQLRADSIKVRRGEIEGKAG